MGHGNGIPTASGYDLSIRNANADERGEIEKPPYRRPIKRLKPTLKK
jgi:hypothetical protein